MIGHVPDVQSSQEILSLNRNSFAAFGTGRVDGLTFDLFFSLNAATLVDPSTVPGDSPTARSFNRRTKDIW